MPVKWLISPVSKPVTSRCVFYASSCECGLFELLSFGFVLGLLGLLGFGFAVQVLDSSFSLVSLIHRLAVSSISIYQEWQDPETSRGVSGVKSQPRFRKTCPKSWALSCKCLKIGDPGSTVTTLINVFPPLTSTHGLSASNHNVCLGVCKFLIWVVRSMD